MSQDRKQELRQYLAAKFGAEGGNITKALEGIISEELAEQFAGTIGPTDVMRLDLETLTGKVEQLERYTESIREGLQRVNDLTGEALQKLDQVHRRVEQLERAAVKVVS